jgi:hypothetical protein
MIPLGTFRSSNAALSCARHRVSPALSIFTSGVLYFGRMYRCQYPQDRFEAISGRLLFNYLWRVSLERPPPVTQQIKQNRREHRMAILAPLLVADLSTANPNVYLEVGYAWGKGIPTVLLARDAADLRFDVKGQRCLLYNSIRKLEASLKSELKALRD